MDFQITGVTLPSGRTSKHNRTNIALGAEFFAAIKVIQLQKTLPRARATYGELVSDKLFLHESRDRVR